MYEVTKACSRGEIKNCGCNKKMTSSDSTMHSNNIGKYAWSGCSDNVLYGHKLSKYFVDAKELTGTSRLIRVTDDKKENLFINREYKLMNLHNNEVGRRVSNLKNLGNKILNKKFFLRQF